MKPIILEGRDAFSQFRISALLNKLKSCAPHLHITSILAHYVYFLQPDPSMDSGETISENISRICSLLDAEDRTPPSGGFFVIPRKGTISPWSSKATDIFHNCGMNFIKRVERGIYYQVYSRGGRKIPVEPLAPVLDLFYDRMIEGVYLDVSDIFTEPYPAPLQVIDLMGQGRKAIENANVELGLALSDEEIDYITSVFSALKRNPTDMELVTFAQVNSEHCRHKIFNAEWFIDGERQPMSLFDMIRYTHACNHAHTLVAYRDNAAVIEGFRDVWLERVRKNGKYAYRFFKGQVDIIMKVETHNHPTAISPYPGAATGVGGEIRDESAAGRGGKSKAGLCAFIVSNLRIPGFIMPWEKEYEKFPSRLATPFQIMIEGPIGAARFGNEFGRPQLCGIFKTFEEYYNGRLRGYHKPVMVAGGMGNIKRMHILKRKIPSGAFIVQIGGPALKIGLGGGTASSMATGSNIAELDFNSVQRDNAEMQRRCQEVIESCIALGKQNPILSIHDLGAGGLSNGVSELVAGIGGRFKLRKVPNEDPSMSPMQIWCCEAQERYVLAINPDSFELFKNICKRERCPVAHIGTVTGDKRLIVEDEYFKNKPMDIDIDILLGRPPRMVRKVKRLAEIHPPLNLKGINIQNAVERVLRLPAVANKTFLITIADRTITGMVARDQMVGAYQTPVSDVAVTITSYKSYTGEAMAMGERTILALVSGPASGRMAIGEALTNIVCANIGDISKVKLSANWMCACGEEGEDANLYDTVKAVGLELCPALGISIPVGKDSLSMRTIWKTSDGKQVKMTAPLTLVVSAFADVQDVRKTVTPELKPANSRLLLIDIGKGKNRLGGSALARVYNQIGCDCPDLDDPVLFKSFFNAVQEMVDKNLILAYHDRSDGGVLITLIEMSISARTGLDVEIGSICNDPFSGLFSEELGAVIQVADSNVKMVYDILKKYKLEKITHEIATTRIKDFGIIRMKNGHPYRYGYKEYFTIYCNGKQIYRNNLIRLNRIWSELTYRMQSARDNPEAVKQEYDALLDKTDPGRIYRLTYPCETTHRTVHIKKFRPKIGILREQGINGHIEMAAAFESVGFECIDVHMTDLIEKRLSLKELNGIVACGGFSYGDVLGAGAGWAKSILYNPALREMFANFFAREDTFSLGVCNGCQMLSQLREIIPGAEDWPVFKKNVSEQFEARYTSVEVLPSPSILLKGMEGSILPIPVAHGEGQVSFKNKNSFERVQKQKLITLRYVDNHWNPAETYPYNPNGSRNGITGLTTPDGRVTIMMPHPERAFRSVQLSYRPAGLFNGEAGPWLRMFQNAYQFVK